MNAISVGLRKLEKDSKEIEEFPSSTLDLVNYVDQNIPDNPDKKDPIYNLFVWSYARQYLTIVIFVAAILVSVLTEWEFIKLFHYERWAILVAIIPITIVPLIIILLRYTKYVQIKQIRKTRAIVCVIDKIIIDRDTDKISASRRRIEFTKKVGLRWGDKPTKKNILKEGTLAAEFDTSRTFVTLDKEENIGGVHEIPRKDGLKKIFKFAAGLELSDLFVYQIVLPQDHYVCHYDTTNLRWLIWTGGGKNNQKFRASLVTKEDTNNQNITWVVPKKGDSSFLLYFLGPDKNILNTIMSGEHLKLDGSVSTHIELDELERYKNEEDDRVQFFIEKTCGRRDTSK